MKLLMVPFQRGLERAILLKALKKRALFPFIWIKEYDILKISGVMFE